VNAITEQYTVSTRRNKEEKGNGLLLEIVLARAACLATWERTSMIAFSGVDPGMAGEMSASCE
jgi:hypothetical protein